MEILRVGSFMTADLEAARLSAAEVALESHVEQRLQAKPTASHVSREWLRDRRNATRSLEEQGVKISVVASPGRIKS
jgi:hypothetical protein